MADPLSPLNEAQLNANSTPMTAHREAKIDHVAAPSATPSKQDTTEVIDWSDDEPSSPFMTDAAESRAASRDWRLATGNEKTIYEDPSTPKDVEVHAQNASEAHDDDDKENTQESSLKTPVKKNMSPSKSQLGSVKSAAAPSPATLSRPTSQSSSHRSHRPSSRPVSRDEADAMAMPPPSTSKTMRMASPRKTATIAAETPLPKSRNSSFEKIDESEVQLPDDSFAQDVDETSVVVDETNVDDTCFSTFSAVPDMTVFAKMGDAGRKSPIKNEKMVSCIRWIRRRKESIQY